MRSWTERGTDNAALDRARKAFAAINGVLDILPGGAEDPELQKFVEEKLEERRKARAARDFARADSIRDELVAAGIEIKDGPTGTSWKKLSCLKGVPMSTMIYVTALAAGVVATFREAMLVRSGRSGAESRFWQRASVIVAVGCVVMALVGIAGPIARQSAAVLQLAMAQLAFGVAALVVFGTRWRPMVDGLAAIALGIFSILSGFSIGFFTIWIALVLGIAALIHSIPSQGRPIGVNSG